jgi:HD-GYP domain-containing protein (c-di-GMP phosphodiesterase class II)
MQLTDLAVVRHRIQLGAPLPFNVRNAEGALLLAGGHCFDSADQLDALLERGAWVDLAEIQSPAERARQAPREQLPGLWSEGLERVNQALLHAPHPTFKAALNDASEPVLALVERDPDLAIFQVVRQEGGKSMDYGVQRSLQAAITAYLVANRLAWTPAEMETVFKVALTMNVSMLELQGELARQRTPPTAAQRMALQTHPLRSVEMLEAAGVTQREWLQAVERHHENEEGSGYPSGTTDVGQIASLVRRADVYTSKLASRSTRDALSADVAGRQMFMQDPGHPMTAALVKEFGVFPPGCHVRLASGETALVVQRGPTVTTPVVACLTDALGRPLPTPQRRDTTAAGSSIVAVIGERVVDFEATASKLMLLTPK